MADSNPHENRTLAMLDRPALARRVPPRSSPSAIYAGDRSLAMPATMPIAAPRPAPPSLLPRAPVLQTKSIKCVIVLESEKVCGIRPGGGARMALAIEVGGRRVTVDLATKSFRKAQSTITEHGPDNIAACLQGRLMAGDVLADAGITAQLRGKKL